MTATAHLPGTFPDQRGGISCGEGKHPDPTTRRLGTVNVARRPSAARRICRWVEALNPPRRVLGRPVVFLYRWQGKRFRKRRPSNTVRVIADRTGGINIGKT